jgi:hypothetical protein
VSPAEFNERFPHGGDILLGVVIFLILAYILFARYQFLAERKLWNYGICPKCNNGFWKSFDTDSQGATGCRCTNPNCDNGTWFDYATWRHDTVVSDVDMEDVKGVVIIIEEKND